MDFLSICQRIRQESAISGTGPTTVVDQTGDMGRVVDWGATGYQDVTNAHRTWNFLRNDFSFLTTATKQTYTASEAEITDEFGSWRTKHRDDTGAIRVYVEIGDESRLEFFPWDEFQQIYRFGSNRTQTQRPSVVSIKPDDSLILWPIPNLSTYTVNGEFYKIADPLALDADTPAFPAEFHMIVVWRAVMYYAVWAAADEKYANAKNRYDALMRKLEMDKLDRPLWGKPLA